MNDKSIIAHLTYTESFWDTEMGIAMIGTVKLWDASLKLHRPHQQVSVHVAKFEAFRIGFKAMFGIDVYFVRRPNHIIAICDRDGRALWQETVDYRRI